MTDEKPTLDDLKGDADYLARTIYIEGDEIVLNVAYEYGIELQSCNTYRSILGWALHLSEKTWMTKELIEAFIIKACNASGLEIPHP